MKKQKDLISIISKISTKETPFYPLLMMKKGMSEKEAWKDYYKKKEEGYFDFDEYY